MKIYVGNLPWTIDDDALSELFEEHGEVSSAKVVADRETGRSRGFGFVEMDDEKEALAAVDTLDGEEIEGRTLQVDRAREKPPRQGRRNGGRRNRKGHG
jgi:RNA recognition motif-containing protein